MFNDVGAQFEIGKLRLIPGRRTLLADGRPVAIHGRAFDLLATLVEHRDRVVGRDELLARVWAGTTVSDGNIAVQVASLRRILAAHGIDPRAIATIPGRGYRYVGEVSEPGARSAASQGAVEDPTVAPEANTGAVEGEVTSQRSRFPSRRRGWLPLAVGGAVLVAALVVVAAMRFATAPAMTDVRLSVEVLPFEAHGPGAADLAVAYTNAMLSLRSRYEDLRLYGKEQAPDGRPYRFHLSGMVQVLGTTAELTYQLVLANGDPVHGGRLDVPVTPSQERLAHDASLIERQIARPIFRYERQLRVGPPTDAVDWLIEAKMACHHDDTPECYGTAIKDLDAALALDREFVPASLLMAVMLDLRAVLLPAQDGDGDSRRALAIVDGLLAEDQENLVALETKAEAQVAIGEPGQAISVLDDAARIDPFDDDVKGELLDAYEEDGRFGDADDLLAHNAFLQTSSEAPQLHFAEGRYAVVVAELDNFLAKEATPIQRHLMSLLRVASLIELHQVTDADASTMIRRETDDLPPAFRTQAGLRRTYFELPPAAWNTFKAALSEAGMHA